MEITSILKVQCHQYHYAHYKNESSECFSTSFTVLWMACTSSWIVWNLSPKMKHHPMIYHSCRNTANSRSVTFWIFICKFCKVGRRKQPWTEELHLCIFCSPKIKLYTTWSHWLPANETSFIFYKLKYYI